LNPTRLDPSKLIRPQYSENFRCIGSDCEDTCCQGWGIPIDKSAYEKYRNLPASGLRNLIQISCLITPEGAVCRDGSGQAVSRAAVFAKIRMTESNQCPMLSGDGLYRIQSELGAGHLSQICATYPRIAHTIDGIEEKALALSCPEAARVVLLNPGLFSRGHAVPRPAAGPVEQRHEGNGGGRAGSLQSWLRSWFWPIRESVLGVVRNRSYALWQRLFLLGILCRRLDSLAKGELDLVVPAFLTEFEASIASGSLRTAMEAMETLPADLALQLDVVLRLAGMVLQYSSIHPRFAECIEAFKVGIGNGPGATLESLAAHYAQSHDQFYAPFFRQHPFILENYLINTIVRCRFPLREGAQPGASPSMAREHALLTAQFALMKGLLIGVAGCHREAFSTDHVVHTVQSASRHFEHHPDFLNQAYALLVESQMDGARGLAILLRNTEVDSSRAAAGDSHTAFPQAKAS
jgi:lysine-N-methylase